MFFLLNIVRVLITKLKVSHSAESNTYMKAVRATLILVPLLGAQFIVMPSQPKERTAKAIYEFIMNLFMHFQVKVKGHYSELHLTQASFSSVVVLW